MQGRKIIKKLVQITTVLLLLLFALPAGGYLLLQSSHIQTKLASRVMEMVSKKLNTTFTIKSLNISFLYRVRLNEVYLQDMSGDTLLYAESLTAGIRFINPVRQKVSIGSINLDHALFSLAIDSAHNLNLNYFLDKLKKDGQGKGGWEVKFNNVKLRNSRFFLKNYDYHSVEFGMNPTDIRVSAIDADLARFNPSRDSLSFLVKSLRLKEAGGFVLNKLSCKFSQSKTFLSFRDIIINTPQSGITGDEISFRFRNWDAFKADSFISSVRLRINLSSSQVNLKDIAYFAPSFRNTDQLVTFEGLVTGPINNIKGRKLDVRFGNNSRFSGELSLEGLPKIRETFILADINELTSSAADLEALRLPGQNSIRLPEQVNKLGLINYRGNYTGFINDFVAYGRFSTALGFINTDLLFRPDSSNLLDFEGKFDVQDFDLGSLLNASRSMGRISLKADISGATMVGKSINASLKGMIERFDLLNYEYTNINLSGNLVDKTFNGEIDIHDPNIDLEFLGEVNLSDSMPTFNFKANITDANLYALNINKSDPDFRASFYLIANAQGNSINTLNGEITLLNSLFVKKDKQLQIYDLQLFAENLSGSNRLKLRSDFMDADISGNYELTRMSETLKQYFFRYLPSLADSAEISDAPLQNSLTLHSTIKNIKPLLDFFLPEYQIAENSTINLTYTPEIQTMHFQFQTTRFVAKGITWNNLNFIIDGNEQALEIEAGGSEMMLGNRIQLENFTVQANTADDTAGIFLRWNNWQDLQYRGTISALAKVTRQSDTHNPHLDIFLHPTSFITNDTLWAIQPGHISLDSTTIRFDNLVINHQNEYFRLNGALSENPADELNILFNHFNLGNLNGITMTSGYKLGGILDGKATISDIYNKTLFTSLLKIDSLIINNEILGNTEIISAWDDEQKVVDLKILAIRDNLKIIEIKGVYMPEDHGKLAFELNFDKLRLNLFNPYVNVVFNDLRGMASGKASLSGTLSKPLLNGEFNLQKTSFTVNYLQTRYLFTEKVQIENNNIYFKDVRIYDPKGNSAYLNGAIRNRYLKDFYLDLTIRSQDFMCMNTTLADNKNFYGTAFATGVIKIYGPPKNIILDISARTDKNTSIKIPLSNSGELNEYPFITVDDERLGIKYVETDESDYQVDLSGMQINFDLEVTPDAEVQIIFDPKLGDIIKGRGNGNLDMKINTSGDFFMYGEYVIEEGDYLFTLQNIINKKLTIEPGGLIRWNGDPLDATISIVANYRTRASIGDLLGTVDDQKVVVDDRVTMTGKLMSPDIKYDIYLPNADESTRLSVNGAITSSEELNKQFISILTLNRFYLSPERNGMTSSGSSTSYSGAAGVSASEFLSNQLSNWLSQIVNDMDVDFNYRSNREMKSDEVQLALSYQLFNDRLTINVNGSMDMSTNAAASASDELVGEFDIDYKLVPNGKLRLKTYNHANNDMLYENSSYTQGFGFTYKEEFNTLGELLRRYSKAIFGKKNKEEEPVTTEKP